MRVTGFFEIALPKEAIDLHQWVTEMTDADYHPTPAATRRWEVISKMILSTWSTSR